MNENNVLLAADIGNSSIDVGLFEGNELKSHIKLPSETDQAAQWDQAIAEIVAAHAKPRSAIICSVKPEVTTAFSRCVVDMLEIQPSVLAPEAKLKLSNLCREPARVGADRIANAYGAWKVYGLPAIVVDVGTAITIDAVNKNAEFLGGAIAAGPELCAVSLARQTAQLPEIRLRQPDDFIGRDTESALLAGIMHGTVGMVDYIARKMKQRHFPNEKVRVIFTGGWAEALRAGLEEISSCVDPDLTLKGLHAIYYAEFVNSD